MAPATKKQRVSDDGNATAYPAPELSHEQNDDEETETEDEESPMSIIAQFQSEDGMSVGPQLDIPLSSNVNQMEVLVNELLQNGKNKVPYSLFVGETEITTSLQATVEELKLSTETALTITFQPLAVFRVRPVTRCSDTLQGHSEAILHVSFSPDGKKLASGGGDATVRFWDTNTWRH
uniref:NLE domain-containing protein n=1 Tax=Globisporangium ultimum (strain ATCC 200006 / CBS 805.95 / DAOM BR144) TaxID=431595 RepID=K3WRG0_GLOUD